MSQPADTWITIQPTAISGAVRVSPIECPVARAIRGVCHSGVEVVVSLSAVQFRTRSDGQAKPTVCRLLPESLRSLMASYDNGDDFPAWISFSLDIPDEFLLPAARNPPGCPDRPGGLAMIVSISAESIATGKPCHPKRCPLAIQLKQDTGHPSAVYKNAILVRASRYDHIYEISDGVREFLTRFDAGKPVQPCVLDIGESTAWARRVNGKPSAFAVAYEGLV